MNSIRNVSLGNCRFEVLLRGDTFLGLGAVWIGGTQVRSGRLPLCVETQSFPRSLALDTLQLLAIVPGPDEIRIRCRALFRAGSTSLMRDHSFDPIHNLGDWGGAPIADAGPVPDATLDLVLRPAQDEFNGTRCAGFSYHYEYASTAVPLFYLLDKSSWELDGDITGATAISQSSCTAPVHTFGPDTSWGTEGVIFFDERAKQQNPIMTHNLPRWASHGAFDFQYRGSQTLLAVFERVELIRSVLKRESGAAELKCFDKHIFDQSLVHATVPRKILLTSECETETDQQNLWTWVQDEVYARARAEFGLREEPLTPRLSQNFWVGFTTEDYERDLLSAAAGLGMRQVFVDNLNSSDLTCGYPTPSGGNMCCGHDYELAESLGGTAGAGSLVRRCRDLGITPYAWTNNAQSYSSPLHLDPSRTDWFVKMEDSRLKYGGAYSNLFSILNFKKAAPRRHWVDALKKIKAESGLSCYLFDSFYNLGFMPVDYDEMAPTTQWRELLGAMKELQDEDIHFLIESFGPFGQPQHGCPTSYNLDCLFVCYKVGLGSGYTTVPGGSEVLEARAEEAGLLYRILAHMTDPAIPLFVEGERIDRLWTAQHRQALADFHANGPFMYRRYLQEDGSCVLWHDTEGRRLTVWNFVEQEVRWQDEQEVVDATENQVLRGAERVHLQAGHTYIIEGTDLPRTLPTTQRAAVVQETQASAT